MKHDLALLIVHWAGPILLLADVVAILYVIANHPVMTSAYRVTMAICATAAVSLLLLDAHLWWTVATDDILPWLAALAAIAPALHRIAAMPPSRPVTGTPAQQADRAARQAWWWALGLLLPSALSLVDLFAERIPQGSLHHALEYLGLVDVLFQVTAPITLAFAAYVLIRYRRIGIGRWVTLFSFWVLRLWTVHDAVRSLVDSARMHG